MPITPPLRAADATLRRYDDAAFRHGARMRRCVAIIADATIRYCRCVYYGDMLRGHIRLRTFRRWLR